MISVGFIGLGLIGERRRLIARALGVRVVFVVDPEIGRRLADTDPECRVVSTINDLSEMEITAIQAVFIAVPHDLAAHYCRWALSKGLHVLCEKPSGISLDEVVEIGRQVKGSGTLFCAGFNYRYLPGVNGLVEELRNGRLGTLNRVRMVMGHGGRPGMECEWKLQKCHAGGGALIDPGIHLVDLVRYLIGEPIISYAHLSRSIWQCDVEDNCLVLLRCDKVQVILEVSLTRWKNEFTIELFGSDGQISLRGRGGHYGPQQLEFVNRWFWQDDQRWVRDFGTTDPSFVAETRSFLNLIAGGGHDGILSNVEDAIAAMRIIAGLYEADPHAIATPRVRRSGMEL